MTLPRGAVWVSLLLAVGAVVLAAAEPEPDYSSAEEREWDAKVIDALNAMHETYAADIEDLKRERASGAAEDKAKYIQDYKRLTRNVAVRISHMVLIHPLGRGTKRIRIAFERSDFRGLMQWNDLFGGDNSDLIEDEDL